MFHDLEEVSNEKLQIRACVPDLSELADEFMQRFPKLDIPDEYGNRQIIIRFDSHAEPDVIYEKALEQIKEIIGKHNKGNEKHPICFDTTFYE